MESGWLIRILRAPSGSPVETGSVRALTQASVVLGRSPEADIVLMDASVSRRHASISLGPPAVVEALTSSNGTFLNEMPIEPGRPLPLPSPGARLQLGGVVLEITPLGETRPVLEVIREDLGIPLLEVTWDAGQCAIRCSGRPLPIAGAASQFFGALADSPGEIVHHWDLQQLVGTAHLAPLATAARRALAGAIRTGALDAERLLAWHEAQTTPDPEPTMSTERLLRWVVQSRRGHGYVLNLPPHAVVVRRI